MYYRTCCVIIVHHFPSSLPCNGCRGRHGDSQVTYLPLCGVGDGIQSDGTLVGQEVEDVESSYSLGPSLLITKYQIYPLVQLARHKLTLQSLGRQEEPWLEAIGQIERVTEQILNRKRYKPCSEAVRTHG